MRKYRSVWACHSMLLPLEPNGITSTFSPGARYWRYIDVEKNGGVSAEVCQIGEPQFGRRKATEIAARPNLARRWEDGWLSHIADITATARNAYTMNRDGRAYLTRGRCNMTRQGMATEVVPAMCRIGPRAATNTSANRARRNRAVHRFHCVTANMNSIARTGSPS